MKKLLVSSVKKAKKEIKSYIFKQKSVNSKSTKAKEHIDLFNKGKEFLIKILSSKNKHKSIKTSREFIQKNKSFFSRSNLKALLVYIFSDFDMEQIENMLDYIFGNLSSEEKENVLIDIIDHINNKEYGFLLKD